MADPILTTGMNEIIKGANVYQCGTVYSNYAQFVISDTELFLDFYFLEPPKPEYVGKPIATLVARVAVPNSMAKGITTALANVIENHDQIKKVKLINQRGKHPTDTIEIWKDD